MNTKALWVACAASGMCAIPAEAHHSFAKFDAERTVTIAGTVKEFQWTNPHAWIILMVDGIRGHPDEWAVEMSGTGGLARQGWRPKTLYPAMPVTLTIHPLRDGTNGGQFVSITLPDGTKIGQGTAEPGEDGTARNIGNQFPP